MDYENEKWVDIPHYEGRYLVSNYGRVFSLLQKRILKQYLNKDGYCCISLTQFKGDKSRKSERVHRLVALAFIPNPDHLPEVNHKNGIRSDNRVENLEWMTHEQNNQYKIVLGTTNHKKIRCVETGEIFEGSGAVERATGADSGNVRTACRNKNRTVFGKHYEYITEESNNG